ncbi:MAG: zf-HC2 domain-containing protein [Planctomycetota bacterium]
MDCQGVHQYMELWLDEELGPSSRREFSDHLDACGPCRERVEGETRLERAIRDRVPRERMPAETWTRITRRLEREARPARRGAILALAVTLAACGVFALTWYGMWRRQKPDLATAAIGLQRKLAASELKLELRTNSADKLEEYLLARLGMQVDLQHAMSGKCGQHDVKFEGAAVVTLGDVQCACLAYRCCGSPVTVVLMQSKDLDRFPEMRDALAKLGPRLHDEVRSTNIEVRSRGPWLACLVGDHPIEDLASVFEKI